MKRNFFLIVLLLPLFTVTFSQINYRFKNITTQQGMYYSHVYSIIEDKYGFIWISDSSGLNRYDGYSFTDFSYKEDDDKTIKESSVKYMGLDTNKNLWVVGESYNMLDCKTEKFIQYPIPEIHYRTVPDSFPIFNGQKFIQVKFSALSRKNIKNIFTSGATNGKNFWLKIDRMDSVFIYLVPMKGNHTSKTIIAPLVFADIGIQYLYADPKGTLWVEQNGMLKYYSNEKKKLINFISLPSKDKYKISCMLVDTMNRLWIGCNNYEGLKCINLKTKKINEIKADKQEKDRLYADNITTIFEDSFGLLWIGTENNSIYTTNLNVKKFEFYSTMNGLPDNNIRSVFEDSQGNRYFGSSMGLTVMQPNSTIKIYKADENKLPHLFINNNINTLHELPGHNILTGGTGLSVVNFSKRDYYYLMPDSTSTTLASWVTYDIHKGQKSGHYWISCQGGFNEIDDFKLNQAKSGITKKMNPEIKLFNEKDYGEQIILFWSSYEDKDGIIWLCSSNGVIRYNPSKNTFKHYIPYNNPNALHAMDVNSCYEDSKNRLWFASLAGGLSRLDRKTEKFYTITKNDGLPSNTIYGILEDSKGNLWISSNNGLCKYNPDSKQVQCYDEQDGIQGTLFNHSAYFKSPDGKMYFGGTSGATAFYPDSITENKIPTKIVLSKLYINNKPVKVGEVVNGDLILKKSLMESQQIELSNHNKVFAIEFACIQTVSPERVKCKYIMEGYDKDWITTDAQPRRAYFSNLPAGTYVFKVKACNGDGVWNSPDCSVQIKIKPPFYKTLWFRILCLIAGIRAMNYYTKYRERKLKEDKKILEQKVEERTFQLKEVNEELSSQAEILAIQKEDLAIKNKDITDSIHYAKRIQQALFPQHIMDERKDILIFYRPKDIVSGDFYWFARVAEKEFIAAVDCTGHGVPGAFMSIIGSNILTKIVKEYKMTKPSEILFMLNSELRDTLKSNSSDDEVKDGMDLSLIGIDLNLNKVEYAGAMNSIYLIRNEKLTEFKADRNSIWKNTDSIVKFTNHEIEVRKGDVIYLFSDGFNDQFGGPSGKRFKASQMKELLISIASLDMQDQYNKLNIAFEEWKGNMEQIDDVLVIGRKFT